MARNIDDFADKKQSADFARLHSLAGEFGSVDAAGSDFRFFVALGVDGHENPLVQIAFEPIEGFVGPGGRRVEFEPALR